ncbi:MAG: hypothetical protein CMJ59_24265 [Planctomycetaceae bacterium]|nr:hypothetical protein [Planctomycetaceae bacterium]
MSSMEKSKETVEVFFAPDDRALECVTPNLAGYYYFAVTAANARTAQHGDVYSDTRNYKTWPGEWEAAVGERDDLSRATVSSGRSATRTRRMR